MRHGPKITWKLRYGVLYIASAERFESMPVIAPRLKSDALRKLRLPVSFKDASLEKIGTTLKLLTGVPFIVPKNIGARTVIAQAREVTLEQALALMLYPYGWTAVEKDGAVHVEQLKN